MKTIKINGRTFELITAPKKVEEIKQRTYCGTPNLWYDRPSATKMKIYHNWREYFNETATGHCSHGVSSANTFNFTIVCDIRIDNINYRMYITPAHNYIIEMD